MATIVGNQELVKRALEHIDGKLKETPQADIRLLVDDAAMRFNLSPKESESLYRILRDGE